MKIKQFRYAADNLGYLIHTETHGMAVDAGAAADTLAFARQTGIEISYVTNTHGHHDHTPGNETLLAQTNAQFLDCAGITGDTQITLGSETVLAFPTPGHTRDSICFYADGFLVTGDTLFNATVGNCFSGDLNAFYHSLKRLMEFPAETRIFAGHDYVAESIQVARLMEPDNPDIDTYMDRYDSQCVVSKIGDELRVNPYLRFNTDSLVARMKGRQLPVDTEEERFVSLMEHF